MVLYAELFFTFFNELESSEMYSIGILFCLHFWQLYQVTYYHKLCERSNKNYPTVPSFITIALGYKVLG